MSYICSCFEILRLLPILTHNSWVNKIIKVNYLRILVQHRSHIPGDGEIYNWNIFSCNKKEILLTLLNFSICRLTPEERGHLSHWITAGSLKNPSNKLQFATFPMQLSCKFLPFHIFTQFSFHMLKCSHDSLLYLKKYLVFC